MVAWQDECCTSGQRLLVKIMRASDQCMGRVWPFPPFLCPLWSPSKVLNGFCSSLDIPITLRLGVPMLHYLGHLKHLEPCVHGGKLTWFWRLSQLTSSRKRCAESTLGSLKGTLESQPGPFGSSPSEAPSPAMSVSACLFGATKHLLGLGLSN